MTTSKNTATPETSADAVDTNKVETVALDVTLSNGVSVTLDVIKDQGDWAYEAVEAMAEGNYPVMVNAIITRGSKLKLKLSGARVRDFELITEKVSEAIGSIREANDGK
nr:hypothetical protein [Corynebacterium sp. UBA5992]